MSSCADMGCSPLTPCQRCLDAAFASMTDPLDAFEQVSSLPDGGTITRHTDDEGRLHDSVSGPALVERSSNGTVRVELHAQHGVITDVDLRPAHIRFYPTGAPHIVEHYANGVLHDQTGPHGLTVPAVAWFTPDGRMMKSESWNNGVRRGESESG